MLGPERAVDARGGGHSLFALDGALKGHVVSGDVSLFACDQVPGDPPVGVPETKDADRENRLPAGSRAFSYESSMISIWSPF
jgi:hypothetical protein